MDAIHEIVALYDDLGLDGGISVQPLQKQRFYVDRYKPNMQAETISSEEWRGYSWVIDAAVRRARVRDGIHSYYGALFADFDPASRQCPWLQHGAFISSGGAISGCCYMKDPKHAFGHLMVDSNETIDSRRRILATALDRGDIPPPCQGCGVANMIAKAPAPMIPAE
jgi:hypothetical protein